MMIKMKKMIKFLNFIFFRLGLIFFGLNDKLIRYLIYIFWEFNLFKNMGKKINKKNKNNKIIIKNII